MEFIIIGIVSALNLMVIVHKFRKNRVEDGILDSILFGILATLFSGSYGGMVVAMIASLTISIYLWTSPPKFFKSMIASEDFQAIKKDFSTLASSNTKKSKTKVEDVNFD
jgi:hypothetical protein